MNRALQALLGVALIVGFAAWAQQAPPAASPPAEPPRPPAAEADDAERAPPARPPAAGADDDEFVPTEELAPDAAVTFPVDI